LIFLGGISVIGVVIETNLRAHRESLEVERGGWLVMKGESKRDREEDEGEEMEEGEGGPKL
jgi:hypothetical protein